MPWDQTIIYEAHVKGFTKLHPAVDETSARGFYAGLGSKEVVDYIKSLGVTTVELLPVHTFLNDSHLLEKGLTNYWGYNSIGFFAPDPRYASDVPELAARIQGDDRAVPRRRPRGDSGRRLQPHGRRQRARAHLILQGHRQRLLLSAEAGSTRYYINDTGTGNTLNISHPRVIQMVTDSLRYWVSEMHVDGFRFDLGTILAREPDGFQTESGFLKAVGQDPAAGPRQADRGALGLRSRRLSGRRLSAGLGRVERHVPRYGARLLARRVERQGACAAPLRIARQIQPSRPEAVGERQFRRRP